MNTRRHFLKTGAALAAGFGGLQLLTGTAGARAVRGYGALRADPKKILDLPKGFSYRVISKAGTRMADGLQVPGAADGMAAFPGENGLTVLVRNHELNPAITGSGGAFGESNKKLTDKIREKMYDAGGRHKGKQVPPSLGGTTTVVYDTKRGAHGAGVSQPRGHGAQLRGRADAVEQLGSPARKQRIARAAR